MSSRKRRDRMQHGDAFDLGEAHTPPSSLQDFADKLYSTGGGLSEDLKKIDAKTVRVKNVPVDKARPDPAQARRVMPAALRGLWLRDPNSIHQVLEEWLAMVDAEAHRRGRPPVDVPALLASDPEASQASGDESVDPDMGPIEHDFRAMLQLAASIRHHGLANPITVVQGTGDTYVVETGERRLLAYNLLLSLPHLIEGDWSTIPARVVDTKSVWRQAAENGARQNLNAISIARQLALLLMDVYGRRRKLIPYGELPDVEWYAQVADGRDFPIPRGRGAELLAAMGLKNSVQLRQYRQLLRLPSEVWEIADQMNWAEFYIRGMLKEVRLAEEMGLDISDSHLSVTAVTLTPPTYISDDHLSVTAVTLTPPDHISKSHSELWGEEFSNPQIAERLTQRLILLARRRASGDETPLIPATQMSDDEFYDDDESWKLDKPIKSKKGPERFLEGGRTDEPRPKTIVKKGGAQLVKYDPRSGTVTFRLDDPPDTKKIPNGGRWVVTLQYVEDPSAGMDEIIYEHFNPPSTDDE